MHCKNISYTFFFQQTKEIDDETQFSESIISSIHVSLLSYPTIIDISNTKGRLFKDECFPCVMFKG